MKNTSLKTLFNQALNGDGALSVKQQSVLQASLELFAQQGVKQTTTKQIATRAGVAEGTVYKQFKTKEALLEALLKPFFGHVLPEALKEFAATANLDEVTTLADYLDVAIDNRLNFIVANRDIVKIIFTEVLTNPDFKTLVDTNELKRYLQPFFTTFQKLQDAGEIVDWPIERIAQFTVSTVGGYAVRSVVLHQELDVEQSVAEIKVFLQKGLSK
jgi:AcrR family transcriptional regulator